MIWQRKHWPDGAENNKEVTHSTPIPFTTYKSELTCLDGGMTKLSVSTKRNLGIYFSHSSIFISHCPAFSSLGSIPTRTTRTELQSHSNAYMLLETQGGGSTLSLLFPQRKITEILISIACCIGFFYKCKRTLSERFWAKKGMCCLSPWCFSCLVELSLLPAPPSRRLCSEGKNSRCQQPPLSSHFVYICYEGHFFFSWQSHKGQEGSK